MGQVFTLEYGGIYCKNENVTREEKEGHWAIGLAVSASVKMDK